MTSDILVTAFPILEKHRNFYRSLDTPFVAKVFPAWQSDACKSLARLAARVRTYGACRLPQEMRAFPGIQIFCWNLNNFTLVNLWGVENKISTQQLEDEAFKRYMFPAFPIDCRDVCKSLIRVPPRAGVGNPSGESPGGHRDAHRGVADGFDELRRRGVGRTAANSFAPCQTPQPPAPRFVLPARWLHLPYGTQSSTHRPGMLYAMMIRWSWWVLWLWWQNVSSQVWWLVLTTRTHMCRFDCKEIQGMPECHMLLKNSNFFA